MTDRKHKATVVEIKRLLGQDDAFIREGLRTYLQEVLETEMTQALGAVKGERTGARRGYRSGYYERSLVTRVGPLELRVPQDRDGLFSTAVFELYQRSEKALVAALAEMYVQGVSTRKVKAITEALCGHSFSASTISAVAKRLDGQLAVFSRRRFVDVGHDGHPRVRGRPGSRRCPPRGLVPGADACVPASPAVGGPRLQIIPQ